MCPPSGPVIGLGGTSVGDSGGGGGVSPDCRLTAGAFAGPSCGAGRGPGVGGGGGRGAGERARVGAHRLVSLGQKLNGMKSSFEYIQDYVRVYGLKIWQEVCRVYVCVCARARHFKKVLSACHGLFFRLFFLTLTRSGTFRPP